MIKSVVMWLHVLEISLSDVYVCVALFESSLFSNSATHTHDGAILI